MHATCIHQRFMNSIKICFCISNVLLDFRFLLACFTHWDAVTTCVISFILTITYVLNFRYMNSSAAFSELFKCFKLGVYIHACGFGATSHSTAKTYTFVQVYYFWMLYRCHNYFHQVKCPPLRLHLTVGVMV